jgi:hypothetical protein
VRDVHLDDGVRRMSFFTGLLLFFSLHSFTSLHDDGTLEKTILVDDESLTDGINNITFDSLLANNNQDCFQNEHTRKEFLCCVFFTLINFYKNILISILIHCVFNFIHWDDICRFFFWIYNIVLDDLNRHAKFTFATITLQIFTMTNVYPRKKKKKNHIKISKHRSSCVSLSKTHIWKLRERKCEFRYEKSSVFSPQRCVNVAFVDERRKGRDFTHHTREIFKSQREKQEWREWGFFYSEKLKNL